MCVLPSNPPPHTHTGAHAHTLRCAAATQSVWFPTQKGCELLLLFIPLSYFMSLSHSLRTICSSIAMLMTPPPRRRAPNTQPAVSLNNSNLFVAKSYEFLCIFLCLWEKLDLERTFGGGGENMIKSRVYLKKRFKRRSRKDYNLALIIIKSFYKSNGISEWNVFDLIEGLCFWCV